MANKLILDFENNTITWDTDHQQGTELCPDLTERKAAILQAMGYETVDLTPEIKAFEGYMNGKITEEELKKELDKLK